MIFPDNSIKRTKLHILYAFNLFLELYIMKIFQIRFYVQFVLKLETTECFILSRLIETLRSLL